MGEHRHHKSRWGADDQKGNMNLVTPDHILRTLKSVKQGRMLDMSHDLKFGAPTLPPFIAPYLLGMWSTADTTRRIAREHMGAENDPGVFTERVELCMHSGTHIDALGHFTIGDEMFNGFTYQDSTNAWGLERLGIEQMPPMITRGIVLDVAGSAGGDFLEGGAVVGRKQLEAALDKAKLTIEPGDVVMIRTGWGRFYGENPAQYSATEPGLDEEAAHWLTERQVSAIGSDTMAVEVLPGVDPKRVFPVHQHCLAEAGVHLIENLAFDSVMQEGVTNFCFVLIPVKFAGATGCPVRPIALL